MLHNQYLFFFVEGSQYFQTGAYRGSYYKGMCVPWMQNYVVYLSVIVLYLFQRLDYEFKWRLPLSELAGWTNAVIKRVPLLISTFQPEIQDKTTLSVWK